MEQKQFDDPWFLAQITDSNEDHIFYTLHDPSSRHHSRIPELVGRRVRACFHGWIILSNRSNLEWSLWNPITSKLIRLPPLVLKDGDSNDIVHCCLSSPPDHPTSVLLLTRHTKRTFVFCRLDRKLPWTEMSYAKQLETVPGNHDGLVHEPPHDGLVHEPICCNDKVYVFACSNYDAGYVMEIHIVVKEKEVVISLSPFVRFTDPRHYFPMESIDERRFLKGSCTEMFVILACLSTEEKLVGVFLYKLDTSSMVWAELEDIDGIVFFVDLAGDFSVNCSPAIGSESGGYVHFLHKTDKVIYSYHVKEKTISLTSMDHPDLPPRSGALRTSHLSIWAMPEFRLPGDLGDGAKCKTDSKQDECKEYEMVRSVTNNQSHGGLLAITRYSHREGHEFELGLSGIGQEHSSEGFIGRAPLRVTLGLVSLGTLESSLCRKDGVRKLPSVPYVRSFCFSAPPTSPDCMVVGFSNRYKWNIWIHFVAHELAPWRRLSLNLNPNTDYRFLTFCGRDVYTLSNEGIVDVFREISDAINVSWEPTVEENPRSDDGGSREYFQMKCNEHDVLVVVVGEFGESVKVWKLKDDEEWEKVDSLGRHVIYICGGTCVCMDAKTPEMENKIYFPRLHSKNGKIVFYSMETRRYHTFDGRDVGESFGDFFGTKHYVYAHAWIDPTWH